ncbi:hypothetical protein KCU71_g38, partial [Aureobasidium melanogenum]
MLDDHESKAGHIAMFDKFPIYNTHNQNLHRVYHHVELLTLYGRNDLFVANMVEQVRAIATFATCQSAPFRNRHGIDHCE